MITKQELNIQLIISHFKEHVKKYVDFYACKYDENKFVSFSIPSI